MAIKEDCYWYDYEQDMGARIPFCKLQKGFNPLQSCEGCNQYHNKYKRTQADRIRCMSDEKLARFIVRKSQCPDGYTSVFGPHCVEENGCEECWLEWLKKEADNG